MRRLADPVLLASAGVFLALALALIQGLVLRRRMYTAYGWSPQTSALALAWWSLMAPLAILATLYAALVLGTRVPPPLASVLLAASLWTVGPVLTLSGISLVLPPTGAKAAFWILGALLALAGLCGTGYVAYLYLTDRPITALLYTRLESRWVRLLPAALIFLGLALLQSIYVVSAPSVWTGTPQRRRGSRVRPPPPAPTE